MIKGIGLDMIDLDRIAKAAQHERFLERILTQAEKELYDKYQGNRQIEFLAGRFAAKEAYAKANGTGFGPHLNITDVEILYGKNGEPCITKPVKKNVHIFVSITHTEYSAAAQVIIEQVKEG